MINIIMVLQIYKNGKNNFQEIILQTFYFPDISFPKFQSLVTEHYITSNYSDCKRVGHTVW